MSNIYPPVPPRDENLPLSDEDFVVPPATVPPVGSQTGSGQLGSGQAGSGDGGKADVAKEQAAQLGDETAAAGHKVAGVTKDEASKVVTEAKTQAKDLFHQAQGQLSEQAGEQQKKVASGLRSVSDELKSMADSSEKGGMASDLVHQAASKAGSAASWLDQRDPGALLDEVRRFARQRPGTFIGIAAVAGVLAGRLTRSLASEASDHQGGSGRSVSDSATNRRPGTGTAATTPVYDATLVGEYEEPSDFDSLVTSPLDRPTSALGDSSVGQERL